MWEDKSPAGYAIRNGKGISQEVRNIPVLPNFVEIATKATAIPEADDGSWWKTKQDVIIVDATSTAPLTL